MTAAQSSTRSEQSGERSDNRGERPSAPALWCLQLGVYFATMLILVMLTATRFGSSSTTPQGAAMQHALAVAGYGRALVVVTCGIGVGLLRWFDKSARAFPLVGLIVQAVLTLLAIGMALRGLWY